MKTESVIVAKGLDIGYSGTGGKTVHSELNFELRSGELTSLLGANGAGKSTLIRTLCGFQKMLRGDIKLFNKRIGNYRSSELSEFIGVVLTDKDIDGGLTVFELIALGRFPYTGFFGNLTDNDRDIVEKSISTLRLESMRDKYIGHLSDGERQKVMIAKTLAQECPIIILDEPTAFLDARSRIEITETLHRLAIEEGKTVLMSTHDVELALRMSDRLWLMEENNGLVSGFTEDLILSGAISTIFGTDIYFDLVACAFRSCPSFSHRVKLSASGELRQRIVCALNRYGITDTKIEGNNKAPILCSIEASEKGFTISYDVAFGTESVTVDTIGELISFIRVRI